MKVIKKILLITLTIFIFNACDKKEEPKKNIETNKTLFLRIGAEPVYMEDFFDFAAVPLREMDEESYKNPDVQKALTDNFIEHKLLLQEAKRKNITIDDTKIKTVLGSFSSEKGARDLKVYSGSYETNNKKLAALMEERLLVESLLNQVVANTIQITETQIKDYYNKNPQAVTAPAQAHILHIFTTNKQTAEKAMAELQKGLSFNEVAERYSEGPEKSNGGDLGFIAQNNFPEIFDITFKLPVGKHSDIVKSDYGYHIFLVKKFEKSQKMNYEDIKAKIYMDLYIKEQENKTKELINELYKKTEIKHIVPIDFELFTNKR